jgi:glycosyltransferase involved in cell wall biosynthesis
MTEPASPAGGRGINRVAVVMPAHNEDQHLGRALRALQTAADALQRHRPDVATGITVVLDSCTDSSAQITAPYLSSDPRFAVLHVRLRSTGASRAAGAQAAGINPAAGRMWLANTDADSAVPENWLVRQLELADSGADAVLGSVEPDPSGMDPGILRRWLDRHPFVENHTHVFGANFGVRASAYLAVGGFPRLSAHEDRTLVERLRNRGFTVTATDSMRVLTSGRTQARAPQGFGAYLRALGMERPAAAGLMDSRNV